MIPLSEMSPGQTGRIVKLAMHDRRALKKLMALGVLPGAEVALIRRRPACVFTLGQSQLAVDSRIAGGISVVPCVDDTAPTASPGYHRHRGGPLRGRHGA